VDWLLQANGARVVAASPAFHPPPAQRGPATRHLLSPPQRRLLPLPLWPRPPPRERAPPPGSPVASLRRLLLSLPRPRKLKNPLPPRVGSKRARAGGKGKSA